MVHGDHGDGGEELDDARWRVQLGDLFRQRRRDRGRRRAGRSREIHGCRLTSETIRLKINIQVLCEYNLLLDMCTYIHIPTS